MNITETVKSFLFPKEKEQVLSSEPEKQNVVKVLDSDDSSPSTMSFFDSTQANSLFNTSTGMVERLDKQKEKINVYRNIAKQTEVDEAIEEIVNEIVFSFNDDTPVKIEIEEENEKIKNVIIEKYEKILRLMNIKKNLFTIVKNSFIDGQINLHVGYDEKSTKNGIQSIKYIEPTYLYFDIKKDVYKYYQKNASFFNTTGTDKTQTFSVEELVHGDFGIYENGLILSYVDKAIKTANQLRTLEDLLIPLRFSRSVSRRVFNVDIGDLPNSKGEAAMRDIQTKFRYNKFYNVDTGEISNQQHVTSMVEDYWFANRSGGKGTQVETLDETGNLGELDDILYFYKKLYRSMKIPSNRISIVEPSDFDYAESRVTKEDIKFFMYVSRLRSVYIDVFKELLRREIVSTGVLTPEEWITYSDNIKIYFTNENHFIQKMEIDTFTGRLELFANHQDQGGKIFSIQELMMKIFKMTDEEVIDNLKAIKKESKNPLFSHFYNTEEE